MTPYHDLVGDNDQHVYTSHFQRAGMLREFLASLDDFESFIAAIGMLSPQALARSSIHTFTSLPSDLIISALPEQDFQIALAERSGDRIRAAGSMIHARKSISTLNYLLPLPPEDIHSMQRGEDWIGDVYSSDMVIAAFAEAGCPLLPGQSFYDYGCSSGPLLRVLAWCYPDVMFYGSDPVKRSILWAQANLRRSNLAFFDQQQSPPLPFSQGSFDRVSAISIFSHHGIRATKQWFAELARVLKPGGALMITVHGPGSVHHYASSKLKPMSRYKEILISLLTNGYTFEEVWLGADDVGNVATESDWGNSYFVPDVLVSLSSPLFDILLVKPRANQDNQDVYVLRRR